MIKRDETMKKKQQKELRLVDAPVFSYWQALYMAFYSRKLYVDVAKRWKGVCFFYLFLMIAVASIPLSARLIFDYNQFITEQIVEPLATVPPLELRDGVISFNEPMPYFVKSKTGATVAMIDTRTDGMGMKGTSPELMLLVTRDKFYVRPPTINLFPAIAQTSESQEPVVTQVEKGQYKIVVLSELVKSSGLLSFKWLLAALIYPFVVSFFFGVFFSLFLIIAMIAQVYSWLILRFKIKFIDTVRLLIVSSTAQLSVLLGFLSVNYLFPGLNLLCLVLCMVYFSYAIMSVKKDSQRLVHT